MDPVFRLKLAVTHVNNKEDLPEPPETFIHTTLLHAVQHLKHLMWLFSPDNALKPLFLKFSYQGARVNDSDTLGHIFQVSEVAELRPEHFLELEIDYLLFNSPYVPRFLPEPDFFNVKMKPTEMFPGQFDTPVPDITSRESLCSEVAKLKKKAAEKYDRDESTLQIRSHGKIIDNMLLREGLELDVPPLQPVEVEVYLAPSQIPILVLSFDGKRQFEIPVRSQTTVLELKHEIWARLGHNASNVELYYGSKCISKALHHKDQTSMFEYLPVFPDKRPQVLFRDVTMPYGPGVSATHTETYIFESEGKSCEISAAECFVNPDGFVLLSSEATDKLEAVLGVQAAGADLENLVSISSFLNPQEDTPETDNEAPQGAQQEEVVESIAEVESPEDVGASAQPSVLEPQTAAPQTSDLDSEAHASQMFVSRTLIPQELSRSSEQLDDASTEAQNGLETVSGQAAGTGDESREASTAEEPTEPQATRTQDPVRLQDPEEVPEPVPNGQRNDQTVFGAIMRLVRENVGRVTQLVLLMGVSIVMMQVDLLYALLDYEILLILAVMAVVGALAFYGEELSRWIDVNLLEHADHNRLDFALVRCVSLTLKATQGVTDSIMTFISVRVIQVFRFLHQPRYHIIKEQSFGPRLYLLSETFVMQFCEAVLMGVATLVPFLEHDLLKFHERRAGGEPRQIVNLINKHFELLGDLAERAKTLIEERVGEADVPGENEGEAENEDVTTHVTLDKILEEPDPDYDALLQVFLMSRWLVMNRDRAEQLPMVI